MAYQFKNIWEIEGLDDPIGNDCLHEKTTPNVPQWIQDIVYIHQYRNKIPEEQRYLFDWWCHWKGGGDRIIGAEVIHT